MKSSTAALLVAAGVGAWWLTRPEKTTIRSLGDLGLFEAKKAADKAALDAAKAVKAQGVSKSTPSAALVTYNAKIAAANPTAAMRAADPVGVEAKRQQVVADEQKQIAATIEKQKPVGPSKADEIGMFVNDLANLIGAGGATGKDEALRAELIAPVRAFLRGG